VPALVIVIGPAAAVVTALLITKLFPVKAIPDTPLVFKAPLNVVVPVPALWVKLAAFTVPVNVPVEQLVTVTVPISVPILPETPMVLVVLKVILEAVLPAVPATEDNEIGVAAPAPKVKVTPSERVAAPKVIVPVPELSIALPVMAAAEVPKLMTLLVVVMLLEIVLAPTVWVTPAVKVQPPA